MDNGPAYAGFLIAISLIGATFFVGSWFSAAVAFSDAHKLDAARGAKPIICSFNMVDVDSRRSGQIHVRDGMMRFDIEDKKGDLVTQWGVEIDMADTFIMTQASPGEPFVSIDSYLNLRVQVIEELKEILRNEQLHCAPWWSGKSHVFNVQGHKRADTK